MDSKISLSKQTKYILLALVIFLLVFLAVFFITYDWGSFDSEKLDNEYLFCQEDSDCSFSIRDWSTCCRNINRGYDIVINKEGAKKLSLWLNQTREDYASKLQIACECPRMQPLLVEYMPACINNKCTAVPTANCRIYCGIFDKKIRISEIDMLLLNPNLTKEDVEKCQC